MAEIAFTSALGPEHKGELERLLFFNENQSRVVDGVAHVTKQYGIPRVKVLEGQLRLCLPGKVELQTLFVLERSEDGEGPIGVLAYTREDDTLVVLFVAIDEQYTSRGSNAGRMLLVKMLDEVKRIARRVRGIAALSVYLGRREPTRIAIVRLAAAGKSG